MNDVHMLIPLVVQVGQGIRKVVTESKSFQKRKTATLGLLTTPGFWPILVQKHCEIYLVEQAHTYIQVNFSCTWSR